MIQIDRPAQQVENRPPEIIRVGVEHRGFKERWIRRGLLVGIGAVAVASFELPSIFGSVGDFVHKVGDVAGQVWDKAGEVVGKGKDVADKAAADVSGRESQPIKVDPRDVIRGKLKGRTVLGMAEREIKILHASKKYNSAIPFNDEFVNIDNAVFVGKAYVPGGAELTGTSRNITLTLPQALRVSDTTIRKQPHTDDDPDFWPQVGQLPGAETSPDQAQAELNSYVQMLIANDKEIPIAAACWGMESAGNELLVPSLNLAGFETLTGTQQGVDGNLDNDLRLNLRAKIGEYRSGYIRQDIFITPEDCGGILGERVPSLQDETFVLPPQVIDEYRLKQEKK